MKKILLAGAFAALAMPAAADGKGTPVMDPVVVIDTAVQDSAQAPIVMALSILVVFGAALSH